MSATAAQIAQVRRWVNEPDDTTYDDDAISVYIEAYPLLDERGEEPYSWDTSTEPPTKDDNEVWLPTYDLHAAAADIWDEKAAVVAQDFDFTADGGSYSRSQVVAQFERQARMHRARRRPGTIRLHKIPKETTYADEDLSN
ncbi:MAG: hypothetical protein KKF27_21805 [Gammaproteobacteria bacterium]|nr:hypothetical protein [Gammaproteobacteria bacterium]